MRSFNVSIVHIAFLFSLIFHASILAMNIRVDKPDAVPIEIFKIRYSPEVEEKKEMPIKEQAIAKMEKPAHKMAAPVPEIPEEIPRERVAEIPKEIILTEIPKEIMTEMPEHPKKQIVKEDVYELPEEVPEKPTVAVAVRAETIPRAPEIKELPKEVAEKPTSVVAVQAEAIPEAPKIKEISPKIDFSWIAGELKNRIEAIKSYPHIARRMGIEGTVVMIIEFDKMGDLIDIHIKSSSGHRILDRDAISLIKRVSPLRHDAGRGIVIELPISYALIK